MGSEAYKKRREVAQQNGCRGVVARVPESIPAGLGLSSSSGRRLARSTASTEGTVGQYTIRSVLSEAKYHQLKANTKRLHIESSMPILTDEQLMFKATDGSNKGSQSAGIIAECRGVNSSSMSSVPLVSSAAGYEAYIERERRLWDTCSRPRRGSPAP
ncbi:hypothetical protein M9H77_07126 [Catharanthus roseus]|uniref:Uncharacterized protein n=1 Tax=Catharanthus roseus TaxID=4058 RepID=A0ACC0BU67_CATRO|nr:hypothetical protein M9H77_07126 [Catharanthus roseus]